MLLGLYLARIAGLIASVLQVKRLRLREGGICASGEAYSAARLDNELRSHRRAAGCHLGLPRAEGLLVQLLRHLQARLRLFLGQLQRPKRLLTSSLGAVELLDFGSGALRLL